jgi:hypothetical protein
MSLVVCAPLGANPGVTASYASSPTTVSGTATIINFIATSTRSADGNTFQGYTNDVTFVGDFSGMSHVAGVLTVRPDGSGLFHETATFTGSVLGRAGTYSENNEGTINSDGTFQGRGTIKDGTGGLAGIHGEWTFQSVSPIDPNTATYSGQVHFDPS